MKILATAISLLYFAGLGYVVFVWSGFSTALERPAGAGSTLTTVVVPPGSTASEVPRILAEAGVLDDPAPFQLYVDRFRIAKPLAGGEYAIAPSMSPAQQLARIESGQVVTYTIVIPAGVTGDEVAAILGEADLGESGQLRAYIADALVARRLGVPAKSLEGYLLPDAYDLPRGLDGVELLGRMVNRFEARIGKTIESTKRPGGLGEYEIITAASLVEKAEVPNKERRYYAAYILNRLAMKMPLESVAADEYGKARMAPIDTSKKRRRRRKKRQHPWDTMKAPGLPKTPICNPSIAAIKAVLKPAPVRPQYMVRRDDGTHVYCEDIDCFYAARREWGPPLPRFDVPPPPPDLAVP